MKQTAVKEFTAEIKISGINPYIDIPEGVNQAFGKRVYISVKGYLNETPITGTLVPLGGGKHRLYINTEMRKKSGSKVGDKVRLRLELDTEPRPMVLPELLQQALTENETAKSGWEKLPPSHQREILAYLNYLKTSAALERNIKKVTNILTKTDNR